MNGSAKPVRNISLLILISFLFFLFLYGCYRYDNKYTSSGPQPVSGLLILSEEELEQYPYFILTQQWQYYPDVLLSPDDFSAGSSPAYMRYHNIGRRNNLSFGKNTDQTQGSATYRLLLSLPESPRVYSLALPEIFSAYRLYINGELMLEMGSADPESYVPETGQRTIDFTASGHTELLLAVTDHSHYYSGMTYPPLFGLPQNIQKIQSIRLLFSAAIILITLFVGIGFLYVGLADRQKKILLYVLLCFCFTGFSAYSLYYTFFTSSSRLPYGMELLFTYGFYLLLVLLQSILPGRHRLFYRFTVSILSAFCIIAFLYGIFPPGIHVLHQMFSWLSFGVKLLTICYLVWNAIMVVLHSSADYWMLLACTICFAVSLLADRLMPLYEPIFGRWFPEYGGLLMIAAIGYMLFRYFAHFYQFQLSFEEEKKQFARQAAIQKSHYLELSQEMEKAARLRHDMRHHLRILSQLLEDGNAKKALEYLTAYRILENNVKASPLCPNLIIDAMLQYYKTTADSHQILFDASVSVPETLPVSDTDLAILFGNLTENALEACLRCRTAPLRIQIYGISRDGKLFLRFENTMEEPAKQKNGMFLSSKNGKYGLGTQSVRAVVAQLDGEIDFEEKDGVFRVSIVIPLG